LSEKKEIKVTDKRMFTVDGELRDGFEHLDSAAEATASEVAEAAPAAEAPAPEPAAQAPPPPSEATAPEPSAERAPPLEIPGTPPGMGAPSFMDLIGVLTDPILLYLGDAELPDGSTAENLDLARLHIDLLDVLREKTRGNLSAQESAMLDDLLYQLRMRYVRKRD
jgi:hypothetical protein